MSQHFLLSAQARTLSLAKVLRLSEEEAYEAFKQIRWAENDGEPYCPRTVISTCGQWCRMRRMTCLRIRAASSPEGRLPGRSSESTGLPVAASKMWMGWKQ